MPHMFGHTAEDDETFDAEDGPPGTEWKSDIFVGYYGDNLRGRDDIQWAPAMDTFEFDDEIVVQGGDPWDDEETSPADVPADVEVEVEYEIEDGEEPCGDTRVRDVLVTPDEEGADEESADEEDTDGVRIDYPPGTYVDAGVIWSEDPFFDADPAQQLERQGMLGDGDNDDIVPFMSSIDIDFMDLNAIFEKVTVPLGDLGAPSKSPTTGRNAKTVRASFSIPSTAKSVYAISYTYVNLQETNQRLGTDFTKKKRIIAGSITPIMFSGKTIRRTKFGTSDVIDTRIKDYGALRNIEDVDTNLMPLSTEETLSPIKEFAATLNGDGNASFVFDFDVLSALKQTSLGSIFSRNIAPAVKNEILSIVKILSMEVVRNRVDVQEDSVVIASSSQPGALSLLAPSKHMIRDRNKVDGILLGSICEMNMQGASEIRTFSGMDYSLPQEGKYEYTIKILISDAISDYLSSKLSSLNLASKEASNWAEKIQGPNYSDTSRKTFSYNGSRAIRKELKQGITPVESAMATYSEIAGDVFAVASATEIVNIMYPMVDSSKGSPDGVAAVIAVIKSLENKMSKLLGSSISIGQVSTEKGVGISGARSKGAPPEFERTFSDQLLDTSDAGTGYTFINRTPSDKGVSVLSTTAYNKRIKNEISAYSDKEIVSSPPDITDNINLSSLKVSSLTNITKNLPTYLTPSSINVGGETFDLSMTKKWHDTTAKTASEALRTHAQKAGTSSGYLQFLGALGVTCEILNNKKIDGGTFEVDSVDNGSVFSTTDNFTSKNIEVQSSPWPNELETAATNDIASSIAPTFTVTSADTIDSQKLSLFDGADNVSALESLSLSEIQGLPAQVKCLFLSNSKDTKQNWFELPEATLDVSFNSIARVEALFYKKDSKGNSAPEWSPLTESQINNLRDSSIRCRVVNYSNSKLGIGQKDDMSAPILNSQFVIGGGNISKSRVNKKNSTPQRIKKALSSQNKTTDIKNRTTTVSRMRIPAGMHRMPDGSLMLDSEMPQASVTAGPVSTVSGMGGY
mgnify:FL=1